MKFIWIQIVAYQVAHFVMSTVLQIM